MLSIPRSLERRSRNDGHIDHSSTSLIIDRADRRASHMRTILALAMLASFVLGSAFAASLERETRGGGLNRLVATVMAADPGGPSRL